MNFTTNMSSPGALGHEIDVDEHEPHDQELFKRGNLARQALDAAMVGKRSRLARYLELDNQLNDAMADDSECHLFASPL